MRTNTIGMSARDLAAHAAKLCEQAARHPEIAQELWAEAMACEGELQRLRWRGFASMPNAQRRAIAAKGGAAQHAVGKGFRFDSETGREAAKRSVEMCPRSSERMRELGRIGGRNQRPEHIRTLRRRALEKARAAR